MKANCLISKTVGSLLLTVTMVMYLCTAVCASNLGSCCDKVDRHGEQHHSCCEHPRTAQKDANCNNLHLSYFKTVGQFVPDTSPNIIKIFPSIIAVLLPPFNGPATISGKADFAGIGFYSPPPKADIRVRILSFQI